MGLIKFDLDGIEGYVANHLRLFISMAAGILVFVGIVALSIFFIAVRGAEETMVPEIRGKELTEALLELQVKELYPRIRLRYSQSSQDKGTILEQEPRAGTIVKAGRRINLVVSDGVMVNSIENYTGRNVDEVRMELQTLFASSPQPLLFLKEPFMYQYSAETPGVILRQNPEPGKDISGPTALEFVVSLGPENVMITIPRFVNLSVNEALAEISRTGVDFVFTARPAREGEKGETVVAQTPLTDAPAAANTRVELAVTLPSDLKNDEAAGLFTYTLPKNPYPLPVRLEALLPSGERRRLLTVEFSGGDFTVPYRLPIDTVLILSMVNREIYRETVKPLTDQLYLDQL